MKTKSIFAPLAIATTALFATGCGPQQTQQQSTAPRVQNVLTSYSLPLGGNSVTVTEFRSVADPDSIVIATDGFQSSGIATWKQKDVQLSQPRQLSTYSTPSGDVTEFQPASNSNMLCVYVDAYKSGALTCTPK